MKKFFIKTFGCQMNEHDSTKMGSLLKKNGYFPSSDIKGADIIIFNTCTVRAKPHHKAISELGKALKLKKRNKDIIVVIAGCVAQEERTNLFNIFPDLDIVLGPDQVFRLPDMIKESLDLRLTKRASAISATELINNYEDYKFIGSNAIDDSPMVTSFLTIMKGCNNFCTFCIVPYVRGREVSKSPEEIIDEISKLNCLGVKEVTLLGQNVNSYGSDNENFGDFPKLLEKISTQTDVLRIRYTSPHPKDLSMGLIEQHAINKKLCEHIHLPLQSGSSVVLKRMNRAYTKEDYLEKIGLLRDTIPNIAVTTDIIVGFPGETDRDFEDTLDVMKKSGFDGMFAFKYSERNGTRAAEKFKDDISALVKQDRLAQVLDLNAKIVLQKHQKYVGTAEGVLVEGKSKRGEQLTGRTRTNRIVNFDGGGELVGRLVTVKIERAGLNSLSGRVIR